MDGLSNKQETSSCSDFQRTFKQRKKKVAGWVEGEKKRRTETSESSKDVNFAGISILSGSLLWGMPNI